ncbi:MAG: GtrA family protein [Anaerolinea sp.]|nr:GtrA family protein [Anaerolinea sp.]
MSENLQFVRFMVVLVTGAAIDVALMNILLWIFINGINLGSEAVMLASAGGFIGGLASNYLLHRYWTFRGVEQQSVGRQLPVFVVVSFSALVLRLIVVSLLFPIAQSGAASAMSDAALARTLGANFAQMTAMGVSMVWNYYANRRWTYRAAAKRVGLEHV